jgi:hypothetical protein
VTWPDSQAVHGIPQFVTQVLYTGRLGDLISLNNPRKVTFLEVCDLITWKAEIELYFVDDDEAERWFFDAKYRDDNPVNVLRAERIGEV